MSDQLEMELRPVTVAEYREAQIEAQWRENEADQAAFWTEERRACQWALGTMHVEIFDALPWIERHTILREYQAAVADAQTWGLPVRSYRTALAMRDEHAARFEAMAQEWAKDIRRAFLERRPCPIKAIPRRCAVIPTESEMILERAFEIAQVPAECLPPEPPEVDEKRTVKA